MQSVLINTNLLIACKEEGIKIFFSPVHVRNQTKQKDTFVEGLKENTDAIQLILKMVMVGKII